MNKNYFLSIYIAVLTILYFGSTVNATVGQICTSGQVAKIPNLVTLGVIVDVKEKEWSPGSKIPVKINVKKGAVIKNLIIWAESVDSDQPGTHFGSFSPVAGHVFIAGCGGFPRATITNSDDFNLNATTSITYLWNAPVDQAKTATSTTAAATSVPSAAPPAVKKLDATPIQNYPIATPTTTNELKVKSHHHDAKPTSKSDDDQSQYDFSDLQLPDLSTLVKNYPRFGRLTIRFENSTVTALDSPVDVIIKGSVVFKGVLQLENKPASEIFSFESKVLKMANPKPVKSTSNNNESDQNSSNDESNRLVKVVNINDNIPKNPLVSASYSNFTSNSLYSFVLASLLVFYYL